MPKSYEVIDDGILRVGKGYVWQTALNSYASDRMEFPVSPRRKEFALIKGWYFKTYTPTEGNDSAMVFYLNTKPDPDTPQMNKGHVMHMYAIQRDTYDNVDKDVSHTWNDESPDTGGYSSYEYFRIRTDLMNPGPNIPTFMMFGQDGLPYANRYLWFELDSGNMTAVTYAWVHIFYQLCRAKTSRFYKFVKDQWPTFEEDYNK